MRRLTTLNLTLILLLAGCGAVRDSKLNPINWFRKSAETVVVAPVPQDTDKRALVHRVLDLKVEAYPGGAMVRATGLPPSQGWWDAELKARPVDEEGTLVLEFRVFPPAGTTAVVNQQSREIVAAYALSDIRLEAITRITVQGAGNALSTAR